MATAPPDVLRILLVGVGGQGVLTAAQVLGEAFAAAGTDVRVGQLHGMSQRGGSVECTVVAGPGQTAFVGAGEADVVIGFEPLETVRAIPRMRADTRVVVSTSPVVPFVLAQAGKSYPDVSGLVAAVRAVTSHVLTLDGLAVVARAGAVRTINIVMLGAAAGLLRGLSREALEDAVRARYPARHAESNLRALGLGQDAVAVPAPSTATIGEEKR